jgi:hypothetical protein
MRGSRRRLRKDSKLAGKLEEAAALYASGKSTTEIAEIFGTHSGNVYRILKSCGVPIRSKSEAVKNAFSSGRLTVNRGAANPSWRGGRVRHSAGYVLVRCPEHPRADPKGYVYQHILVAEEELGRPLGDDEVVHHVNGRKDDNRPCNLRMMTQTAHKRLHARLQNGRIGINRSPGRTHGTHEQEVTA